MFGQTFSHGTLRKYVVLFGTIFNNIIIERDNTAGVVQQTMKVPLSYGPKEKFLARLEGDPTLENQAAIVLPRMSFEMTGFSYAATRKTNTLNKVYSQTSADKSSANYQYAPVPYDITFTMSIMVKNAEDGTRIIEQILPYFTPAWTASVELIPEMNGVYDIPLVIDSIGQDDSYQGPFDQRRAIIWTLTFTMKAYLFGPTKTSKIIKYSEINFKIPRSGDPIANTALANTITIEVTPGLTAGGLPTSNAAASIGVANIIATDDYGFITDFTENL
jgi:hypothetical protein